MCPNCFNCLPCNTYLELTTKCFPYGNFTVSKIFLEAFQLQCVSSG